MFNSGAISCATLEDCQLMEHFYEDLLTYLSTTDNPSKWTLGLYPTYDIAKAAFDRNSLFIYKEGNAILGSIILDQDFPNVYHTVSWKSNVLLENSIIVHTLCVHPSALNRGIASQLLTFALSYAAYINKKAVRLDVFEDNKPAIALYEKNGFSYVDTVDLGIKDKFGLEFFALYERVLPC